MTESFPEPYPHSVEAIYRAYEARAQTERDYIGLSALGTDCDRRIWYAWRWANEPETFSGRMLRLFETGHREEERLIQNLRDAGMRVEETDPLTGGQWAFEAVGGHVCGHMDGKVIGVPEAPKVEHVLECKTHNLKSFERLKKFGVKISKPGHYRQVQGYMRLSGLTRAFYIAQCKDNDDLYVERVHYDADDARLLFDRLERIVKTEHLPPKINEDPNARMSFECRYCPSLRICHAGEFARVNCRTCFHSTPIDGGWYCAHHHMKLDLETQRIGCGNHLFIPDLVPGEQIDADELAGTITYKMPDGSTWIDGLQE